MTGANRWISLALAGGVWLSSLLSGSAQDSLSDLQAFRDGCRALTDSRFGTAADHFETIWEIFEADGTGEVEKEFVASRLLEAWVKNGESDRAVQWVDANPALNPSRERLRWSAVAFQQQHRFADAAETYTLLRGTLKENDSAFALDLSVCQALSGEVVEALQRVEALTNLSTPEEKLRAALVATKASRPDLALQWLGSPGPSDSLLYLNLASWNLIQSGKTDEAFDQILASIMNDEESRSQREKFLLLESAENAAGIEAPREWIQSRADDATSPHSESAAFYLARSQGNYEPEDDHPESVLPDFDYLHAFDRAIRNFQEESFSEAGDTFLDLAKEGSLENRHRSLYNSALASLQDEDFTSFLSAKEELRNQVPRSQWVADLNYLAGLFRAARAESDALTYLQNFIRENPNHPHRVEAQLALAEIHLNQAPARPKAARQIFESLQTQPLSLTQNERLDYTSVWLELINSNFPAFTAKAESFLNDWPGSAYFPEVSMLLAKQLFSEKRLEESNILFETVANRFPESDFADLAVFFAAKSSPPGEDSISVWQTMAKGNGPYALSAQHELGLLYLKLDQFTEARDAFEAIINAEAADPEIQMAALADLGFTYYLEALALNQDETLLAKAAETFSQLSSLPEAPPHWRYSAALRRARCLEATENQEVALEIYRSIVAGAADSGPGLALDSDIRSQEWIFRAGFFAINLLQEKEDWKAAIKMADDLSRKSGPRAIEASRVAEEMRLKYWVWE
ncbi:MAG: tetratricopeptide repeat protein [Verrucomicrobiales bacterium]|nr:tetratricopeptide repeat protein [Verrucomicrobiales bacterium]